MDLNNADGCRRCEGVHNQFHANGVQAGGNSMKDISPRSGSEDEFVAEGFRNGTPGFEERFEMGFGGLLKTQGRFAPVASVRVTAGQQTGLGNPDAIFILSELHLRKWNDHCGTKLTHFVLTVKADHAESRLSPRKRFYTAGLAGILFAL